MSIFYFRSFSFILIYSLGIFGFSFSSSLKENLVGDGQNLVAVPDHNGTGKSEPNMKEVTKTLNDLGETLEKAKTFATDITEPLDEKVDDNLNKTGAQPGTNLERGSDSTRSLKKLLFGIFVLSLVVCSTLFSFIWYRRRAAISNRNEIVHFRNRRDGKDEELGFGGRKFPQEFEISRDRITLLKLIGRGSFGLVYKTSLSDGDGIMSIVAVKIPKPDCSKDEFKSILSGLKVLCGVGNHPHVLEFVGAYIREIGKGTVYIATQFCENGTLQECLQKAYDNQLEGSGGGELVTSKSNLDELELPRYAQEIAMGMEYLSSRKVILGNLSTSSVLMDSYRVCKIGNFTLSMKLNEYEVAYEMTGAPLLQWRLLAIESLRQLQFSPKSDVWSYGITLWQIYSLGRLPYQNIFSWNKVLEELEQGFRMSAPSLSTDAIYEQMRSCWDDKPERRPTFTHLAEFFASTRSDMEYTVVL